MKKFVPQSPDPALGKTKGDNQLARLAHVNAVITEVNKVNKEANVDIPFMWYPPAALIKTGPSFIYNDGVKLISYHIKGVYSISNNGNGFEAYLCTINFPAVGMGAPFIFPGSITGMFQSGTGPDIVTTPLANGGLVEVDGNHMPVSNLTFNLYNYGSNPESNGSYNYALVASASTEIGQVNGLMSYDFEFLMPDFITAPTIFQD
jgi:hypothetical protein